MPGKLIFVPFCLLTVVLGCSTGPVEMQTYAIVSDGPAPSSVTLTHFPPQGATQTLDYESVTENLNTHVKDLRVMKIHLTIQQATPDFYVKSSSITDYKMLRNDMATNVDQEKNSMESARTVTQISKIGDYMDGPQFGSPISYHFPTRPLKVGDSWKGWRGADTNKQDLDFTLANILHSKGHDLALVTYGYSGAGSEEITVSEWIDVDTGWAMKVDEKSRKPLAGRDMLDWTIMCDPLYEH